MKKIIGINYIVQLVVFTIISIVLFFQNRYINMFYKNISYIDVLVSDEQAFEAFLDWTEERDIVVFKIAIDSDNEVTIYMSNWALQNNFVLLEGQFPKQGEYVSDIITGDPEQSGKLKPMLPNYNFKIYGLYKPELIGFSNLYAINVTSEQEIINMKNELASQGVTIEINEIWKDNSMSALVSSFSTTQVMLALLFFLSSILVVFVSLLQFVIQKMKDINILISLGCGKLKIISSIIGELFSRKMRWGIVGVPFIILNGMCFMNEEYRAFYIDSISIFLLIMFGLILTYLLILCIFVSVYLFITRQEKTLSMKRPKPGPVVQMMICGVKLASVLLFLIAVTFLITVSKQYKTEKENLERWTDAKDIYKVSMNDAGQELGVNIEVELHKKISKLYQQLSLENNAFFMDADNIYAMDIYGEHYPLTGLITNGYYTHITVSPNYFKFNPIVTSEDVPVEDVLVYSENVLNLLVPESLSSIYEKLNDQFLDYFDFYRFRVYEEIYSDSANDLWNPPRQEKLEINIIPVKAGQWYFTFSPKIRQNTNNSILDPVVVVYTNNFHPSSTFTKASRCLYFQYDSSQMTSPDDYLAEIVGMNDFVSARSVWKDVADRVSLLHRNYMSSMLLTVFIAFAYLVSSFSLLFNCFMRKEHCIAIKSSGYRRYASSFMMQGVPTLFALFLFGVMGTARPGRLFPSASIQGIIFAGILLIGMDILSFMTIEKILRKNKFIW